MKVGIEIPEELHVQVKVKAAQRGVKLKDVWREALEVWVRSPDSPTSAEFDEQLRIAREGMKRYRTTLRELAR